MLLDEDTLTDHLSGGLQQSVAMFRASVLKSPLYSEFFIVNIPELYKTETTRKNYESR